VIDVEGERVMTAEEEEEFLFSGDDLGATALLAREDPAFQSAAVGGLAIGAIAKAVGASVGAATGLGLLTVFLIGGAVAADRDRKNTEKKP
jgi:hypothetical protein